MVLLLLVLSYGVHRGPLLSLHIPDLGSNTDILYRLVPRLYHLDHGRGSIVYHI